MPYPVSEEFNDKLGRWITPAIPWDATMRSHSVKSQLNGQKHTDIRTFRGVRLLEAVPQDPDLVTPPQSSLEAIWQKYLEVKYASTHSEDWLISGTGVTPTDVTIWNNTTNYTANTTVLHFGRYYTNSSPSQGQDPRNGAPWTEMYVVGALASRGGWPAMQVTTTGTDIDVTFVSRLPHSNIDISDLDRISLVMPDYNSFTADQSYIQFSSHPEGSFDGSDSAWLSDLVYFNESIDSMPHLLWPISTFTSGAGSAFDLKRINGVRIRLRKTSAAPSNQKITLMALRAIATSWQEAMIDYDTRWQVIYRPVTLDGTAKTGLILDEFQFIRGDGGKDDPYFPEGDFTVVFHPGGSTSPPDAQPPNYNYISLLLRENKDVGAGTGSEIHVRLLWNSSDTKIEAQRVDTTGGSPGTQNGTTLHTQTFPVALDPEYAHAWVVRLRGKTIEMWLYALFANRSIAYIVFSADPINDNNFIFRNGRVGFTTFLRNRDAFIDTLLHVPTSYALLRTKIYKTRTPVDGIILSTISAPDANLFTNMSGDVFIDQTKTKSGLGSYRTTQGVQTNQFIAEDWLNTYLQVSMWVSANVTPRNQPVIYILSGTGTKYYLKVPILRPNQWNDLFFDLGLFRNLTTGLPYSIVFEPAPGADKPLGHFWIDDIIIGRRKVQWSGRANRNAVFRRFNHMINRPYAALHFTPDERGTDLQLQCEALTPDAWVLSFDMWPHYAELGLPLYDRAFDD
ncbi:MAG: hypothetical protein QW136_01180 [Nitrososphaerales archaeon]